MKLKRLILITILTPICFLIIGVPLAALSFNNYKTADFFTSLPLITNQTLFNTTYYININFDSDVFNFTMNIPHKTIKGKDTYILHNMFGYQINASLIIDYKRISSTNASRNTNLSETVPIKRRPLSQLKRFKSAFKKIQISKNVYNVFCPYSTEITRINEVDQYCRYNHIPMPFNGNYSFIHLFKTLKIETNDQITIQFKSSFFYRYNFFEIPEAYIIFISYTSNNAMFYSGVVMLLIGAIAAISLITFLVLSIVRH